jgi:hypothetical protein
MPRPRRRTIRTRIRARVSLVGPRELGQFASLNCRPELRGRRIRLGGRLLWHIRVQDLVLAVRVVVLLPVLLPPSFHDVLHGQTSTHRRRWDWHPCPDDCSVAPTAQTNVRLTQLFTSTPMTLFALVLRVQMLFKLGQGVQVCDFGEQILEFAQELFALVLRPLRSLRHAGKGERNPAPSQRAHARTCLCGTNITHSTAK